MSEYIVLTETTVSKTFDNHGQAFGHCELINHAKLCKGVYRIVRPNVLGALNIYGGFDSQHMMQQIHSKQFSFIVI